MALESAVQHPKHAQAGHFLEALTKAITNISSQFVKGMKESTKGAVGMPLAVQVVARRFQEETILKIMREIEGLAKYKRT